MFFSRIKAIVTVLLAVMSVSASAQRYFADGYHGGVYGHYPVMTYTQFIYDQLKQHILLYGT